MRLHKAGQRDMGKSDMKRTTTLQLMAASSEHSSTFDVFLDPITKASTQRKRAEQNIIGFVVVFFFFLHKVL